MGAAEAAKEQLGQVTMRDLAWRAYARIALSHVISQCPVFRSFDAVRELSVGIELTTARTRACALSGSRAAQLALARVACAC